jgi:hypothetical protein
MKGYKLAATVQRRCRQRPRRVDPEHLHGRIRRPNQGQRLVPLPANPPIPCSFQVDALTRATARQEPQWLLPLRN